MYILYILPLSVCGGASNNLTLFAAATLPNNGHLARVCMHRYTCLSQMTHLYT